MERTLNRLHVKLKNSLDKHGEWWGYTYEEMLKTIYDELEEVKTAYEKNDLYSEHGVISELLDVAVCCVKMSNRLRKIQVDVDLIFQRD